MLSTNASKFVPNRFERWKADRKANSDSGCNAYAACICTMHAGCAPFVAACNSVALVLRQTRVEQPMWCHSCVLPNLAGQLCLFCITSLQATGQCQALPAGCMYICLQYLSCHDHDWLEVPCNFIQSDILMQILSSILIQLNWIRLLTIVNIVDDILRGQEKSEQDCYAQGQHEVVTSKLFRCRSDWVILDRRNCSMVIPF